jgi:hypothetical protein
VRQPTASPLAPFVVLITFAKQMQKSACKVVRVAMSARVSGRLRETEKCTWRIFVEIQTWDFFAKIFRHDLTKTGQK